MFTTLRLVRTRGPEMRQLLPLTARQGFDQSASGAWAKSLEFGAVRCQFTYRAG